MLDELLGRAELKDRIEELEEEKRHLERQLEAEQERRADAASARPDAQERANRLEDRIADLEGTVERLDSAEASLDYRRRERLQDDRLTAVLDRLDSVETDPEGALTAYVADDPPDAVRDAFAGRATLVAEAPEHITAGSVTTPA